MDHNSEPIPVQTLIQKLDFHLKFCFFLEMYRNASFLQRTQLALRFRQLSITEELNRRGYTGSKDSDSNYEFFDYLNDYKIRKCILNA